MGGLPKFVIASQRVARMRIRATRWLAMTDRKFRFKFQTADTCPHSRGGRRPRFAFRVPQTGGSRKCRMRAAPAVSRAKGKENAHEHTGSAEALRHSLRNGFTAYIALSPATNSSCHRRRRINGFAKPGWVRKTSANLTPATGARTTRLHRTPQHRSSARSRSLTSQSSPCNHVHAPDAAASTASHPNVRDDRDTPLLRDETAGFLDLIWVG